MTINQDNQCILKEALNFLHVSELRAICSKLSILDKGNKKTNYYTYIAFC
ncbi:MAG: hypothetical protein RCG15_08650 [Candidatus Rickettsia vulgarisii]